MRAGTACCCRWANSGAIGAPGALNGPVIAWRNSHRRRSRASANPCRYRQSRNGSPRGRGSQLSLCMPNCNQLQQSVFRVTTRRRSACAHKYRGRNLSFLGDQDIERPAGRLRVHRVDSDARSASARAGAGAGSAALPRAEQYDFRLSARPPRSPLRSARQIPPGPSRSAPLRRDDDVFAVFVAPMRTQPSP